MRSIFLFVVAYSLTTFLTPLASTLSGLYILIKRGPKGLNDYFFTAAIGFDQAGGSILYSQENYTISSYTFYLCNKVDKRYCVVMKMIDFIFGENHCKESYYWEVEKDLKDIEKCRQTNLS